MKKEDAYRAELAAAHARIAALESELGKRSDPKIAELEAQRAKLAKAIEPGNVRRVSLVMVLAITAVFAIPALIGLFTAPSKDLWMLPLLGFALGSLLALLHLFLTPSSTRAALKSIDEKIAEARRLVALEDEVRATRRLLEEGMPRKRVGLPEDEENDEESAARRKA